MPDFSIRDVIFGRLAVRTAIVKPEQVEECFALQRQFGAAGQAPSLRSILEQKGYLSAEQLHNVLESRPAAVRRKFGEIAVTYGFVAEDQVRWAMTIQDALLKGTDKDLPHGETRNAYKCFAEEGLVHGSRPRIGEILSALGLIQPHHVEAVLGDQSKRIATCANCLAGINISRRRAGDRLRCSQCAAVLEVIRLEDGSMELQVPPTTGVWEAESAKKKPKKGSEEFEDFADMTDDEDEASSAAIPTELGNYHLVEKLGEDAFGQTFRADDLVNETTAAVKVMRNSVMKDEAFAKRFIDAALRAAEVEHPSVVRVLGVKKLAGRQCVAFEVVDAGTALQMLQSQGRLAADVVLRIAEPALAALAAVHKAGVLHRDVRPSNLLVLKDGTVKLAGLGLAPPPTEAILDVARSGEEGTHYLAPELISGDREPDGRADLFALGATMYHLLSGRPPWEGRSPFEVLLALTEGDPPDLGTLVPDLPPTARSAVHSMLGVEPSERPANAQEALRLLTAGRVAEAPARSAGQGGAAKGALKGVAALLVVAVLGGAGGGGWIWWKGKQRQDAFEPIRTRATRELRTGEEHDALIAQAKAFAREHAGTPEGAEAEEIVARTTSHRKTAAEAELAVLQREISADIEAGRFGEAPRRANRASYWNSTSPELAPSLSRATAAAADHWTEMAAEAVKIAEEGRAADASAFVGRSVTARGVESDVEPQGRLLARIEEIRLRKAAEAKAAAMKADEERQREERRKAAEAAKAALIEGDPAFERAISRMDLKAAGDLLAGLEARMPAELAADVKVRRDRLECAQELRAAAIADIEAAQAEATRAGGQDRRLKTKVKGNDARATGANDTGIVLDAAGATESVAWGMVETTVLMEALKRGADRAKSPRAHGAMALACLARADDETTLRVWLMEEADRRAAMAPKEEAAALKARVDAFFDQARATALKDAAAHLGGGRADEAVDRLRAFRNAFSRRKWSAAQNEELASLEERAFTGGSSRGCVWTAFSGALPKEIKASSGWKISDGLAAGAGREESVTVDAEGIQEIRFLFRFASEEFRLAVVAGDVDLRIEPSRPRLDLIVKRSRGTPLQAAFREKIAAARARDWHEVSLRIASGTVELRLNGDLLGSHAIEKAPDGVTFTLSGVSQTQSGAVEIDNLLVRKK